ncbi:dihydrolipoyl dehydrogenase [Tepidanaerobacter sp. GT38]|uniref:dihydrolipoyl dehydrogenase n=1 Tax=Tepidanaerobacter sp. GT38 TaxID=2722793 RepID=UPI001F00D4B4|nr:dihydrolipoyl dehydrogenase [Tepidanaerobacter sp. GT38]MCG1012572.1 dihydrolipoyl dehydrogenase [Tepidanaerobacter sp. GT38]
MHYDIAIIGGGPGGYVAAIYAGKKKTKVALIERGELGGTCLNRGCIPTKTLIHGANLLRAINSAKEFGITAENVSLDWELLQKKTSRIVKTLTSGIQNLLSANKVTVIRGFAKLFDKNTIHISSETGQSTITADNIILATGSVPTSVSVPGHNLNNVITSDQALFLEQIPSSMLIIGGGVIGLEIGYIYKTFGTKVTIVEMLPEILPRQDEEVSKELRKHLERQGIKIYTNSTVRDIKEQDGILQTTFDTREGTKTIDSEKVLMATGRAPVVDAFRDLGLIIEKTGVAVDEYLKTSIDNIYAVGDVTGKSMLAHVASHQGITAVKNILGEKQKIDYKAIPSCIYTSPEVASVGMTEQEARRIFKDNVKVGRFPYAASGKAMTLGERTGFVKIIAESKYNEVLGIHIIGPSATELAAEAGLAIKLECTAEELVNTIHAHPTLSEAVMEAAFDLLAEPIHKL